MTLQKVIDIILVQTVTMTTNTVARTISSEFLSQSPQFFRQCILLATFD